MYSNTPKIVAMFCARIVGTHFAPAHAYKSPFQCSKHPEKMYDCQMCRANSQNCKYVYKCDTSHTTLCIRHITKHLKFMKHCEYRNKAPLSVSINRMFMEEYGTRMLKAAGSAATSKLVLKNQVEITQFAEVAASFIQCPYITELSIAYEQALLFVFCGITALKSPVR